MFQNGFELCIFNDQRATWCIKWKCKYLLLFLEWSKCYQMGPNWQSPGLLFWWHDFEGNLDSGEKWGRDVIQCHCAGHLNTVECLIVHWVFKPCSLYFLLWSISNVWMEQINSILKGWLHDENYSTWICAVINCLHY